MRKCWKPKLWLMQETLMKNEVNVGNTVMVSAHDSRLYN